MLLTSYKGATVTSSLAVVGCGSLNCSNLLRQIFDGFKRIVNPTIADFSLDELVRSKEADSYHKTASGEHGDTVRVDAGNPDHLYMSLKEADESLEHCLWQKNSTRKGDNHGDVLVHSNFEGVVQGRDKLLDGIIGQRLEVVLEWHVLSCLCKEDVHFFGAVSHDERSWLGFVWLVGFVCFGRSAKISVPSARSAPLKFVLLLFQTLQKDWSGATVSVLKQFKPNSNFRA